MNNSRRDANRSYKKFNLYPTAWFYHLEVAIEEFCEMAGASLILFGVMELTRRLSRADMPPAER